MDIIRLFAILTIIAGCSAIRDGFVVEATNNFKNGQYIETIANINKAQATIHYDDKTQALFLFMKAESYEKLNEPLKALGTYHYLIERYPESEYAVIAREAVKKHRDINP